MVSSKDIVSAAMVLVETLLNFLDVQLIGDALPLLSTRNIIIPPWEDPSFRFVYDASQCASYQLQWLMHTSILQGTSALFHLS